MKDVNKLFEEAKEVLDTLGIPYSHRIVGVLVNTRAKSRWGRSTRKQINGRSYYTIEISSRLLEDDVEWDKAMDTMIHEVLHCHFKHRNHTGDWKKYAQMINKAYPQYHIERVTSCEEKGIEVSTVKSYKYAITCNKCGTVSKYMKHSKIVKLVESYPGSCRCGKCHSSNLTVEVLG